MMLLPIQFEHLPDKFQQYQQRHDFFFAFDIG